MVRCIQTGSWFWSREAWLPFGVRVHFFRVPRSSENGFRWAKRLTVSIYRLDVLITLEPRGDERVGDES